MKPLLACFSMLALVISSTSIAMPIEPKAILPLWPNEAPGEKGDLGDERDTTGPDGNLVAGKPVIRLGNVTKPSIALYPPPREIDTGAAVVVFPGGGYHILAFDLEGTEVCQWLNSIGVTAILLKYRVPKRAGLEKQTAALQDAQRALGLVRQHAADWGIDPARIGVIGFSAGGHLAASLCSNTESRTYSRQDAADDFNIRPDFIISIHPGYLVTKENQLAPEIHVTPRHPPALIIMTQDDPVGVENALIWYMELNQAQVPSELHIYPTGGHGYGLRRTEHLVTTWPDRATDWLRSQGWLKKQAP